MVYLVICPQGQRLGLCLFTHCVKIKRLIQNETVTHLVCSLSLSSDILKRQCVSETLQGPAHSPYIAWLTADFLNISNKNLVAQLSLYLAISELRQEHVSAVCFI